VVEAKTARAGGERVDELTAKTRGLLEERLGNVWLLSGTVAVSDRVVLTLQLDSKDGKRATFVDEGEPGALGRIADHAAAKIREALHVVEPLGEARAQTETHLADPEALRFYAEGLDLMRGYDTTQARQKLEAAVARDPLLIEAQSALADLLTMLGNEKLAIQVAQRALEHAAQLPREQRLLLEARYHRLQKNWPRTIELYRALHTFYPDELTYGIELVRAQMLAGHSDEALATVAELRRLPPPLCDDPRIDIREGNALAKRGDWKGRLDLDERAAAKAKKTGARILVATARMGTAESRDFMGDRDGAERDYHEALEIYQAVGDKVNAMKASLGLAIVAQDRGEWETALPAYREAARYYESVGNEYEVAKEWNRIGETLHAKGDFAAAKEAFETALARFTNVGEREGIGNVNNNYADLLRDAGLVVEAEARYRVGLARFREVGMSTYASDELGQIARVLWPQGKFKEADALSEQSVAELRRGHDRDKLCDQLLAAAERLAEEGRHEAARAAFEEARALAKEVHNEDAIGAAHAGLFSLAADAGQCDPVLKDAALLASTLEKRAPDAAASILAELGRCELQTGAAERAAVTVDRARSLAARGFVVRVRIAVAILSARIHAHAGDCGTSARSLDEVTVESKQKHLLVDELAARLAKNDVAHACGHGSVDARARREAELHGFVRLATLR
jgi:tetratricopeptide (TPR) repeat protein